MECTARTTQENVTPPAAVSADALETDPEFLVDRCLAEDFAARVVESYGDHCIAGVFLPWSIGLAPSGVVYPTSREGELDAQQVEETVRGKSIFVIGCTFKFKEEEVAAPRVVEQLMRFQGMCILAAHLVHRAENDIAYSQCNYGSLMEAHKAIIGLGVDDVLLDPDWAPPRLRLRIKMAQHTWSVNQARLQSVLASEPQPPPPEEVEAMEATRRQLLWEDIPREMMPHLKAMTEDLQETDTRAGEYTFTEQMMCVSGIVYQGEDKCKKKVAMKVTHKADVFTPGEVEGIYREFRFLAGHIKHPNVVRALDCFHGPKKIYTVLEFAGKQNIAQYLSDMPGHRMSETDVLRTFFALASAAAHCHSKDVSHRSISLEHVVLKPDADGKHIPILVDFRSAMIAKVGAYSTASCGTLPCVSPEVVRGGQYLPKLADCWSIGVLLLEVAGGKGSFFNAIQAEETGIKPSEIPSRVQLADNIITYFGIQGNHRAALSSMGGTESNDILAILTKLLQAEDSRSDLQQYGSAPEEPSPEE
jgi:hypothetical protein